MTYRTVAIPLAVSLLAVCVPPVGKTQTEDEKSPILPRGVQAAAPPAVPDARPPLTEEQVADLHMARKEYKEASAVYRDLAAKSPNNAVYLNKLGIAYHQQALLSPALKYYERAFKTNPQYADAMNNVGTVWYQRKRYGKAIKAYRKAIAIQPDMAILYSNLGYAYFGDKKYEEAIATFRQAMALDPQVFEHGGSRTGSVLQDRSVYDRGRFYFLLAKSFAQAGDIERSVRYLRKARDEGFSDMSTVKKDPAFAAVLKTPGIEELLTPLPKSDAANP